MSTTPGYVSNAELASRLSTLVDRWNRRENQMIALLTQEEGTVVVTDGLGNNHTLPSFPQLQKDVAGLTDELTGSVVQVRDLVSVATGMANAAQASADDASGFADAAEASAVRAAESAASIDDDVQATADAATFAAAKAAEAADSATEAASSAVDAAASATASATSALASAGSASQAGTSATAAGQARSDAQAAATAAATSRDQAQTILGYATDAADRAEADATAAAASAAAAADSATAAATSVTQATTQANRAEAQASAASTKAGEAAGLATTAAGHASAASGSASAASTSAQTASSAKTAAEAARDKANLYANAPQGTEVSPGEFSAKHWAAQAQAAVTGSLVYMGSWDASTGAFPTNPVKGHFYKVIGEGTVGDIHWRVGDQALYGATWEKIDNTDQVTSVAGKQGDVSLVAGDIGGLGALATRSDVDFNTQVTGKPTTYPPSTHSHTKAQVGLDKVDNTADLDKPVSTAVQAALDGKAAASHTHTIANVTGLQTALDGKAASSHTHTIANVSGLQGALDAKANSTSAQFTNLINIGGASDLSVQLNPTGGRSIRFAATATPNTGIWDATNNVWLFRINGDNSANFASHVSAQNITAVGEVYCNNWMRSNTSGTGWYHQVHGGGWYMADNTWIRNYNGKGLCLSGPGGSGGDLRLESYSPTIACYDTDAGTTHWIHCNDNQHGFLANNAFAWCAYRDASNNWIATGNIVAYASDARLKKNIVDASASKVGDFFDRFRVREFDWDAEAIAELNPTFHPSAEHEVGGIAQEAEEVYSLMVATHANGIKTIQWEKAVPFLIAEVQALRKRVADLGGGA
ncbi:shufflon system plasmid conjugative transfer pilus tip adhesin PilV [Stenotrophomonas maltophilia]|nr:shufflon system plasmid conjugative transfer pilus tip adhesin PilV [Stenotrophomonas maltophilia]MBA0409570.1 shufflon system plasmid conjugative transfer pilus tip adhesin PilV [Stenotrophomonas maltophilia]MBA0427208.1 shufflon system plasmid conjugative transfer pilus tip adhesin PilV [Stenotrophomonas maltophilia]